MNAKVTAKTFLHLALACAAAFVLFVPSDAPVASNYSHTLLHENHDAGAPMTNEAMAQWVREYYEANPTVRPAASTGVPVVTFRAFGNKFDLDGNVAGTPLDTAHILVGEVVGWQRLIGIHTVTNGDSAGDPGVATLFDVPLDAATPLFDFTYTQPGTFPFFCRVHESLSMRGMVIVETPVGVTPISGSNGALGFTGELSPNPTQLGTSFRFALSERGRARAIVIDATGRRVAGLLDETLSAGSYGASWDGRDGLGRRASPGVYFIHLILPGHRSAKRVVVAQ